MWTQQDIQKAFEVISKKAMTDKAFRQLCLDNPAEAIKEATGMEVPENFKVRFVENEGVDATFVLPNLTGGDNELSETELDQVAGGGIGEKCGGSCGGSGVTSAAVICF